MEPPTNPRPIDLGALHQEITAELRDAELRAAALHGQLRLIERLIQESQAPIRSGDALDGPAP